MNEYEENNVELTELAARELIGVNAKNGILGANGVKLLARIHELGGYPISSGFAYMKKEEIPSCNNRVSVAVCKFGPYMNVVRLAKLYGLDPEDFHKRLENDVDIDREFQLDEGKITFKVTEVYNTARNMDKILFIYAEKYELKNLMNLLKNTRMWESERV